MLASLDAFENKCYGMSVTIRSVTSAYPDQKDLRSDSGGRQDLRINYQRHPNMEWRTRSYSEARIKVNANLLEGSISCSSDEDVVPAPAPPPIAVVGISASPCRLLDTNKRKSTAPTQSHSPT